MNRREPTTAEVLATLHTHDGDNIAERLQGLAPCEEVPDAATP